jgi:hypothetical protein
MKNRAILFSTIAFTALSGCSGDGSIIIPGNGGGDDTDAENRQLRTIDNSQEFYSALREGLLRQSSDVYRGFAESDASLENIAFGAADAGATDGASVPTVADSNTADSSGSSTGTGGGGDTLDVTTTNVQEEGVDEQDRMKSDGEHLYVLKNIDYYGGWFFPAIDAIAVDGGGGTGAAADATAATTVELEILPASRVADLTILPPSTDFKPTLRILSLQPSAPDATAITDLKLDLGGRSADGLYLYNSGDQKNVIVTSTGYANYWGAWNDSYAFNGAQSIVSKINVSQPSSPSVASSFKIDGQIISSRRIDNHLFVATRYYPYLRGINQYEMTSEEYRTAVENFDLASALPQYTDLSSGATNDLIDPKGCFVATQPSQQDWYYTPDIVSLAVIDLDSMQLTDSECFLGSSETLYATPNSVFLATTRWGYSNFDTDVGFADVGTTDVGVTTSEDQAIVPESDPRTDTDIHQFAINGSQLTYSGSGTVSGHLGWNPTRKPFRMSEKDGFLRVATFADRQDDSVSPINLTVLDIQGDGQLQRIAQLPNPNRPKHIGKPGEQLYASRFLGNKAYLVTFRQTDPLYVVDLSNPADPKLAGELEIEGYSDYLHPIGEDYLLGIGRDAVATSDEFGGGGLIQGVKLSLFNVSDAQNPTEVQSMVIGERGTESGALQNHRAITVQAANANRPTRVTFGINVHGNASPRENGNPSGWYRWNYTGLHGFEVRTGADARIEQRGVMIVNSASNQTGDEYWSSGEDRSVIVGDSVYYVHGSDVYSANWFGMDQLVGPR